MNGVGRLRGSAGRAPDHPVDRTGRDTDRVVGLPELQMEPAAVELDPVGLGQSSLHVMMRIGIR
jgi:hypothetical protein